MKINQFVRTALVLVLVIGMLSQAVLAAEWYLEDGSITVVANDSGQKVYQGSGSDGVEDTAPVITQRHSGTATTNTITLKSEDDQTVSVTIKDLNMEGLDEDVGYEFGEEAEDDQDYTLIDVVGDSKAAITVKGENLIEATGNGDNAIIHVGQGDLTIRGDGLLEVEADSSGAKIGSHEYEDMSGNIHITDDVKVKTGDDGSSDGAAIGSGQYGDFTGRIQIDGNAEVKAYSNDRGAGIGAGEGDRGDEDEAGKGDFRGTVVIGGNAKVDAEGDDDSPGIGSGENGYFSGGQIIIEGNAYVEAEGSGEAPGIGAADDEPMNGTIAIRDHAEVWLVPGDECKAHIGSEGHDIGNGTIRIEDYAKVYSNNDAALRIGGDHDVDEGDTDGLSVYIGKNVLLDGISGADVLAGNSDIEISAAVIQEAAPAPVVDLVCFYVLDENGRQIGFKKEIVDGTMIITVEQEQASLCGALNNMLLLKQVGVEQIRFVTAEAVSVLVLDELAAAGAGGKLVLTHTGTKAELTLAGKAYDELIR